MRTNLVEKREASGAMMANIAFHRTAFGSL